MVEEVNKAIFRRYVEEVTNRGNLELADEIFDRYLAHQPGGLVLERGPEDVKRFNGEFRSAFHNFRLSIDEQIAEGDKVVSRITVRGTHQREFRGMAPTGKEIELKGITIFRFSPEGKVVETWDSYDQLSLMRHSVEQELRVARSIQQASLPKEVPAREVGGDFYDFFELQEGRGGVVVGDATGKGMPAALVAGAASNMLRAVAQALGSSSSPGEVLAQVNETLLARIPANMFVTCFYAIVEDESGRLLYANAGHNLPCCRRDDGHAAATTTTTDLSARGMPLGIMPQMNYEEKESVLVPGEGVLFYTDGLVEAHNSQGEMFGTPRLRSLLSERPEAGRGLSATLMEELERFTGKGWEQEDDITLLTLERSANRS
jgi:serine phosphatase RsbU (regulator of sigma subunit)